MKRLFLLTTLLVLSGCDSSSNNAKMPEEVQAEIVASQKSFEENRQRIETENKARKRDLLNREVISVPDLYLSMKSFWKLN